MRSPVPGPAPSPHRAPRALGWAALVLAGCLLLTGVATLLSVMATEARRSGGVSAAVDEEMSRLDSRMAAYLAMLQATRAFVLAEGADLSGERFRTFVAGLRIESDYPGIQGIGWSPRVGPGPDDFRIEFLEPQDVRNRAALGFNMHDEAVRAAAMDRARDSGSFAMSGVVVLRQEIDDLKLPGFLIYAPVYDNGELPASLEGRRSLLRGFVYAPFRAGDFFRSVVREDADVAVHSIHVGHADRQGLLYGSDQPARGAIERSYAVAGQDWTLRFIAAAPAPLAVRAIPVGVFGGGILISILVFELVRAQSRARLRAEQRSRVMGEQVQFAETLVGIVSHDLRNPLNVIQLNATLLERAPLRDEMFRCVRRIQASSAMSLRLVRDLLDFTQARLAGGIPVVRSPCDMVELVQQTLDEVRIAHPHRRFTLEALGDGSGAWDEDRIAQLLSNLLNNALVYGAANAPITVKVHCGDTRVELRVHNEGNPIPADLQSALFEPLRQGASRAGLAQRNIGLGLYIVQQIARAHGGDVRFESTAADGTTFIVDLPRAPPRG